MRLLHRDTDIRDKNDFLSGSFTQCDFLRRKRNRESNHRRFLKRFISIKGVTEEPIIETDF